MTSDDSVEETGTEEPQAKLNKTDVLQVIANALKAETITAGQAAAMRAELGVFGSDFTGSKVSKDKKKATRKAQQQARKVTRQHGYKGQKSPSGRASGRGS